MYRFHKKDSVDVEVDVWRLYDLQVSLFIFTLLLFSNNFAVVVCIPVLITFPFFFQIGFDLGAKRKNRHSV